MLRMGLSCWCRSCKDTLRRLRLNHKNAEHRRYANSPKNTSTLNERGARICLKKKIIITKIARAAVLDHGTLLQSHFKCFCSAWRKKSSSCPEVPTARGEVKAAHETLLCMSSWNPELILHPVDRFSLNAIILWGRLLFAWNHRFPLGAYLILHAPSLAIIAGCNYFWPLIYVYGRL